MDLKGEPTTRRRGAELEDAILAAAWAELTENGYGAFTFESVAARAGTSRPVLYRRWKDRDELMIAAINSERGRSPVEVPDTGDLRDDVVLLLRRVATARAGFAALLSAQLAEYFRATGTTFSDLKNVIRISGPRTGMHRILDAAAARGEVDRSRLDERTIELPTVLMRYELMTNLDRPSDEVIDEIVDQVWLPLLRGKGALRS